MNHLKKPEAHKMEMFMGGMSEIVQKTVQHNQIVLLEKEMEFRKKFILDIVTYSYSQAQSYTNLIVGAGYIAFFSIWSRVYDDLDVTCKVWSIIFMILSVIVFVAWEIGKMIWVSLVLMKQSQIIGIQDPSIFRQELEFFENKNKCLQNIQLRVWVYVLLATISFAAIASIFLLYGVFLIDFLA